MLKKLFYIGLGISIIVVKKSVSYLREKQEQIDEELTPDSPVEEAVASQQVADEAVPEPESSFPEPVADDLTRINGIGPTYAKRLMDADIKTFAALSKRSPEELRLLTRATGKAADVESWIVQASSLA